MRNESVKLSKSNLFSFFSTCSQRHEDDDDDDDDDENTCLGGNKTKKNFFCISNYNDSSYFRLGLWLCTRVCVQEREREKIYSRVCG